MFSPQDVSIVQENLHKINKEGSLAVIDERIQGMIDHETGMIKDMTVSHIVEDEDKYPFSYLAEPEILASLEIYEDSSYDGWDSWVMEKVREELSDFIFVIDCGAGACGRVWLVKDSAEQIIALKVIPKENDKFYEQEMCSLNLYRQHIQDYKNLIEVYQVGETESFFYYTMEAAYSFSSDDYIPWSLANILHNFTLTPLDSLGIISDILYGTSTLHINGLAHHDIKPGNIIFFNGTAKLCDIGLLAEKSNNESGGTKDFIPPDFEHKGIEYPGVDGDLFAIGKVLYMMISGKDCYEFPIIPVKVLKDILGKELNKVAKQACAQKYYERYIDVFEFCEGVTHATTKSTNLINRLFNTGQ